MAGKHSNYLAMVKSFGRAVRYYRNQLGLSQEALADRAQLDRSYMSQIERGIKNATLNSIWRIAEALQVRPSDLLGMTDELAAQGDADAAAKAAKGSDAGDLDPLGGSSSASHPTSKGTVLVVDDDEEIASAVGAILLNAGVQALQVSCGMDAIRVMSTQPISAVVSDIRMSNGSGLELLEVMRRNFPGIPLFFITGYDDMSEEDAIRRGAMGLFNKPFDLTSFVSAIKTSVDQAATA